MNAARHAIERLAKRGVRLDYRLTVAAQPGAVDANVKQLLARHKAALVVALALADLEANPPNFPTLDGDGFDWRAGEQTELATIDAALAKHGFEPIDADDFDRRFMAFDPPEIDPPAETEAKRPKRKSPAKVPGIPLFSTDGEPKESEVP